MLGAIESLMSATWRTGSPATGTTRTPSSRAGHREHRLATRRRLPADRAIARNGDEHPLGARTPVAGIVHALTLLVVVLVAAPARLDVPLAVLAGILLVVAYNMGEWGEIPDILDSRQTTSACGSRRSRSPCSPISRWRWRSA
jgi:SulP family sulfate permease